MAGGHPRARSKKVSESRMGRGAALANEPHADPIQCDGSARDSRGLPGIRYHTIDPQFSMKPFQAAQAKG